MNNLLEYKGYHANVELDFTEKIFIGSVLGIDDSLNFHGKTVEELQEQFEICIDDYIEMCKYFGKTPEKEYKGSFNIRIPSEMHKKLDMMAISQGTKINQLIIKTIDCYLEGTPEKEKIYVVPIPVNKAQQLVKENISTKYESNTMNTQSFAEKNILKEVVKIQ